MFGTSAVNNVLISPIPCNPAKNVTFIDCQFAVTIKNLMEKKMLNRCCRHKTFENRLFSIFFAIESFNLSGKVF
jgi:hypothetical protein